MRIADNLNRKKFQTQKDEAEDRRQANLKKPSKNPNHPEPLWKDYNSEISNISNQLEKKVKRPLYPAPKDIAITGKQAEMLTKTHAGFNKN